MEKPSNTNQKMEQGKEQMDYELLLETCEESTDTISFLLSELKHQDSNIKRHTQKEYTLMKEVKSLKKVIQEKEEEIKAVEDRIYEIKKAILKTIGKNRMMAVIAIMNRVMRNGIRFAHTEKQQIEESLSTEKTIEGRKRLGEEAMTMARIMMEDYDNQKYTPDGMYQMVESELVDILEEIDQIMRNKWDGIPEEIDQIAEGKWDAAQEQIEKRLRLFKAAVKAVVDKGNTPGQKQFSGKQVSAILDFIAYEGSGRDRAFSEIWGEAKQKIKYEGWRIMAKHTLDNMKKCMSLGKGIPIHGQLAEHRK